jgi:signal transduction histidine kinase
VNVDDPTEWRPAFLSTQPANRGQWRLALGTLIVSTAVFLAAAPFAQVRLAPVGAFLPIYQAALVVIELVTAVLLFGQVHILRSRALVILGCAYLFSALMAVSHALSFPGLFSPSGLFGAGPQTTAWLYFLWHGGFPLMVIAYAMLDSATDRLEARPAAAIFLGAGMVVTAVLALNALTTVTHDALPAIMSGNRDAPAKVYVATASWLLCLAALPVLWRRRPRTLLDLWLMVVMCVWLFDIALAAVLNAGRYDLGWYAGRVYGLLAGSFVLLVLLLENGLLYATLARTHERHGKRLQILHEIDSAIVADETPEAIAGAAIQSIREVLGVPRVMIGMVDLDKGEAQVLAAAARTGAHVAPGARFQVALLGDTQALRRGESQLVDTRELPAESSRDAFQESGVRYYKVMPMIAGGELLGALCVGDEQAQESDEQRTIAREIATQLSIAISQARLYQKVKRQAEELDARVRKRTAQLEVANRELEAFSYSVSHDLRAPLRHIDGFADLLRQSHGPELGEEGARYLDIISDSVKQMGRLIDDLLTFSRMARVEMHRERVDMGALARAVSRELPVHPPQRVVEWQIPALPEVRGDGAMLRQVWVNLLSNAVKYTSRRDRAKIEVRCREGDGELEFSVHDNGAGFDMKYADKLFGVFQRLHRSEEFEGTGVGLASVRRIVARHGGRTWAHGHLGEGAVIFFTLPLSQERR